MMSAGQDIGQNIILRGDCSLPGKDRERRMLPDRKAESGSTFVEFALVVLVLMTLLLGIIEFSRALYAYHFVDHAAKTATRWAAVNGSTCNGDAGATNPSDPTDPGSCTAPVTCTNGICTTCTSYGSCSPATETDIMNYVKMLAPSGIDPSQIKTTVAWLVPPMSSTDSTPNPNCVPPPHNYPGCTVEVQVSYIFNFVSPLHVGALTFSSSSEMVIAH